MGKISRAHRKLLFRNPQLVVTFAETHRDVCWICELPIPKKVQGVAHPLRASVDHVGDSLRMAHGWCNSRRGSWKDELTPEMRRICRDHIMSKYGTQLPIVKTGK